MTTVRVRLGIVLQTANDAAELTVTETVRHFAHYYADPRDRVEVIETVGPAEKARARVTSFSGGRRRRVDVALGSSAGKYPQARASLDGFPATVRR